MASIFIDYDKLSLYHGFSKTPVSSKIELGNAINKSGHTVSASEVWADEIPYFGKFGDTDLAHTKVSKDTVYGDMLFIGGTSYYKRNEVEYSEGKTFNELWTDVTADFKDGYVFENRHGKGVIVYHENQYLQNLEDANNANTNSENCAARLWVYETKEGETKKVSRLVEQFVGPTDKTLNGLASVSYAPVISPVGGEAFKDGTEYSLVAFSGTVLWAEDREHNVTPQADGSVTSDFQISCFEYIGDKLSTSIGGQQDKIDELSDIISKISVTAAGGVQAVSEAAKAAGLEIDSVVVDGVTTPTLDIETGSVATGVTKLVTGGAVKTYVDTTALASGGSIAEYIENYVATNAKVSVNGQSATTITVKGTEESSSDIVHIKVTEDKTTPDKFGLTLTATIDAAVLNEDGSIKEDGVVIATIAEKIADSAIKDAIETDKGAIKDAIDSAISDATLNAGTQGDNQIQSATGDTANKLVTAAQVKEYVDENAKVTLTAATATGSTGITINPNGQESTSFTIGIDQTVIATKKSVDDLDTRLDTAEGTLKTLTETGGVIESIQSDIEAIETSLADGGTTAEAIAAAKKAGTDAQTAADAKVADVTVDGTSIVSGDAGAKKAALTTTKGVEITPNAASASTALATEASVAKALASINSVGVSYEVIPDGQTHTSITSPVKGRIYLEKETTTNDADAGVYIEWMYTEKGWEQIGSTKTDHSTYASTITVNGSPKTVSESSVDLGAFASSVTAGNGVESGTVSATGALSLVLTTASTSTAGITKLDSTIADSTSETTAATPKAVKEYADTKVGDLQWFNEADILSTKAEIVDGKLVVSHQEVQLPRDWDGSNISKVVNNEVFDSTGSKIATIEFDKMKSGLNMFYDKTISEFSSDMPLLEDGTGMFSGADFTQFVGDLPSLTIGSFMFQNSDLVEFIGDLSSVQRGLQMFAWCNNLTTFTSELSSLTNGSLMFFETNLSLESVEGIADTINTYDGEFSIYWATLPAESERQALVDELSRIVDKGWTLQTNQELLPLFDSEKYETGSLKVQPLDLDSEPQTVYYVRKK